MKKLQCGDRAPDFKLFGQDDKPHKLADYRGKWVLIYFYPKDDTSGCTKEACTIRDEFPRFGKMKAVVFGISKDGVDSHKKFAQKYKLPFTLLADPEKTVLRSYGAWGKKKFLGKEYMGTLRISFLIDPAGKIAKIYEKVKPMEHASEVLIDLEKIRK